MTDDMIPTYSERGFAFWEPIAASYGAQIDVHESSSVEPHLWVNIDGECHLSEPPQPHPGINGGVGRGSAAAHLTLPAARVLRDQLDTAIAHTEARFSE